MLLSPQRDPEKNFAFWSQKLPASALPGQEHKHTMEFTVEVVYFLHIDCEVLPQHTGVPVVQSADTLWCTVDRNSS